MASILYKRAIDVPGCNFDIRIPTVGEVIKDEANYYSLVNAVCAMPIDFMVQLDDIGIDFTEIDSYGLFMALVGSIGDMDNRILFDGLDFSKYKRAINDNGDDVILRNTEDGTVIDRRVHEFVASQVRRINMITPNLRKPANKETQRLMVKRERTRLKRRKSQPQTESHLEQMIVAMVNTEQYKYNFSETEQLTIYQFNRCVNQVIKKDSYDKRMIGVYAGTVDAKKLSASDLEWFGGKQS